MQGLNVVIFGGHLGADPELRHTQGGQSVLTFRVAASERWGGRDGPKQEHTEWQTCVLWGKRADALYGLLNKGSSVIVRGKLRTRKWKDKEGHDRYSTEIIADDIVLADSKGGGRGDYDKETGEVFGTGGMGEDDIPF